MVQKFKLLVIEVLGVGRVCGLTSAISFVAAIFVNFAIVLRSGNLQAADKHIANAVVKYRGARIQYPAHRMDAINTVDADSPSFSAVREVFARDVYLRGFKTLPDISTMIDLGANRGVVSVLGAKALRANWICGVEPTGSYQNVFDIIADSNGLLQSQRHRIVGFIGGLGDPDCYSVDQILIQYGIQQIDFLKCDIEGGENSVFLDQQAKFLDFTKRLVLELHPEFGAQNEKIVKVLEEKNFKILTTCPRGYGEVARDAAYLYASKYAEEIHV